MRKREPLNPVLYRLLKVHFRRVEIVNAGQALQWAEAGQSALRCNREADGKPQREVLVSGEEYRVDCPFCNDTRQRLYINHMWSVFNKETETSNLWLCRCFNEECMEDFHSRTLLHERVFAPAPSGRVNPDSIREGTTNPTHVCEVEPPGVLIRLDELMKRQPNHPAIRFLEDREFDCVQLARQYDVSYCGESRYSLASNRIIIPIREGGKLVGWQARYIGNPPSKRIPKYWTSPGMVKRMIAYNFERATAHHTVVAVEGPTDVWSFGPQAMAVLGKTMNPLLVEKLLERLLKTNEGKHVFVIMLDPKPDAVSSAKRRLHHIDKLYTQLIVLRENGIPVVKHWLPIELDPGSAERQFMRDGIRRSALKCEGGPVEVNFARPK